VLPLDQIDLFGAYVSPVVLVMLACAAVWLFLRHLADALGLLPYLWHPSLFFTALYVIMLSLVGLWIGGAPVWGR
jgi:hypothetical protein